MPGVQKKVNVKKFRGQNIRRKRGYPTNATENFKVVENTAITKKQFSYQMPSKSNIRIWSTLYLKSVFIAQRN